MRDSRLVIAVFESEYGCDRTPITDGIFKIPSDLSININTKFMWLYWSYEYLTEVSRCVKNIESGYKINYSTLLKKSISRVSEVYDGINTIEISGVVIKSADDMKIFLNKYEGMFDGITPATIKMKVSLLDYLILEEMYKIRYVSLNPDEMNRYNKAIDKKNNRIV